MASAAQFARRYRAICGDLSLAISMQFPSSTTQYLHQLVADAYTQLYRKERFRLSQWGGPFLSMFPGRSFAIPVHGCHFVSFGGCLAVHCWQG